MHAFFLIDKPLGITSFDVIRKLKRLTGVKKMGHTGTLDPLATGLLLVAFGSYTKLIPYFEKDKKTYEFEINLEGTTVSLDAETDLIASSKDAFETAKKNLNEENLVSILEKHFSGDIEQIPPKYSALKIGGRKALDLVRAGEEFEMKKRKASIYNIDLLDFTFPKVELGATVSAGTYIRTIAGDLGDIVGTGAYVTKLRRTAIGELGLDLSQKLEDFDLERSLSIQKILGNYKTLDLDPEIMTRLNHGQRVRNVFDIKSGEYFIQNNTYITHIIDVDEHILKMKRKII